MKFFSALGAKKNIHLFHLTDFLIHFFHLLNSCLLSLKKKVFLRFFHAMP